jgi:predicted nucleic acid-binding protein
VNVLVDTSVWSLALRRKAGPVQPLATALAVLIENGRAAMIGPVRQELLSGMKDPQQFIQLRDHLRAFVDTELTSADYEEAATFFNRCRAKGVQGSNTDFLICAVAARRALPIFTTDSYFGHFSRLLPITLFAVHDLTR